MLKSLAAIHALFFPPVPPKPTASELARDELADAQCELLKAQSAREYADAMTTYNQRRVQRLQAYLAGTQSAANDTPAAIRAAA